MVFNVNSVSATNATTGTGNVFAQQGDAKIGTVPIGQNTSEYKQKAALNAVEKEIKAGTVKYVEPKFLEKLMGAEPQFIFTLNDKDTRLGDINARFNLPEGALYDGGNIIDDYGGNRNNYRVPIGPDGNPCIRINAKDLSTATGISEENLRNMVT